MPTLKIENVGQSGVNSDLPPWQLPPAFLTNGRNFRIFADAIVSTPSPEAGATDPNTNIGHLAQVDGWNGSSQWVCFGTQTVKAFDGGGFNDLTPAGLTNVADSTGWSTDIVGQVLFATHANSFPCYWPNGSPIANPMRWLPWNPTQSWQQASNRCDVIRACKNVLFSLGNVEGGTEIYDRVRWSHPAEPNGVPYTWESTLEGGDESSLAGYVDLGSGGRVLDGRAMRDSFVVYSEDGLNVFDYTGDQFLWRRRQISSTSGLLAKRSIVEVKGHHFFISDGDILKFDGNQIESIMHNRLRKAFRSSIPIGSEYNIFAVKHDLAKEIWFCIAQGSGSVHANVAYVYNWRDDSWAIRDLPQETLHASYGAIPRQVETWAMQAGSWSQVRKSWGDNARSPLNETVTGVSGDVLYNLDPASSLADVQCTIQRTHFPMQSQTTVSTVTRVYPHVKGAEPLQIRIGSHQFAGDSVRWTSWRDFNPVTDRKIDVRATGELIAWELRSVGRGKFEFSGMDLDYQNSGER